WRSQPSASRIRAGASDRAKPSDEGQSDLQNAGALDRSEAVIAAWRQRAGPDQDFPRRSHGARASRAAKVREPGGLLAAGAGPAQAAGNAVSTPLALRT